MVHLTITPTILRALGELQKCGQFLEAISDEPLLENPDEGKPISHGQIIEISKKLKQVKEEEQYGLIDDVVSYHLDDLLRGTRVYRDPPKPKVEPVTMPSGGLHRPANPS